MADRIREYEFLESLGKGGMGEVFKARHVLRDRLFAVKVIRKELGAAPQHRQRFLREARILLDLDHPAIVRSLDVFEEQERLYLVMELLEGEPLSALLARATPRFAAGRLLLTPIMEAVAHAHRLGIVHRDLKPANVFILKDGAVKVLDFGLAKELGDASVTTTGQGLGTPAYMAPEVFTGARKIAEIGPEGDVYALGVIAYRLFTGRMPFNLPEDASSLEAVAHLTRHYVQGKQPPDIAAICPEMPKPFAQAVMAALVVNPEARLKDAGEMLRLTASSEGKEKLSADMIRPEAAPNAAGGEGYELTEARIKGGGAHTIGNEARQSTSAAPGYYSPAPALSEDDTIIHSLPKFRHQQEKQEKQEEKRTGVEKAAAEAAATSRERTEAPKPAAGKKWLPAIAALSLAVVLVIAGIMIFGTRTKGGDTQRSAEAVRSAAPSPQPPQVASPAKAAYVDSMTGMEFVFVKGGCYRMGDTFGDGEKKEKPVHEVCVADFNMGKYETTVGQFRRFTEVTGYRTEAEKKGSSYGWDGKDWKEIKGMNWRKPGFVQDDKHPVTCVSWNDAQAFIKWLGKEAGKPYRLPTEAEWEYAARSGGKDYKYSWGSGPPSGNIADESFGKKFSEGPEGQIWKGYDDGHVYTAPVGSYRPNDLGIYDLTGNVWEWCQDWYGEKYYGSKVKENPKGPKSGYFRVLRGGSWIDKPRTVRAASRYWYSPDDRLSNFGFRLVLSPQE